MLRIVWGWWKTVIGNWDDGIRYHTDGHHWVKEEEVVREGAVLFVDAKEEEEEDLDQVS